MAGAKTNERKRKKSAFPIELIKCDFAPRHTEPKKDRQQCSQCLSGESQRGGLIKRAINAGPTRQLLMKGRKKKTNF